MNEQPFLPKPGQTDFTHIRWAPVIHCVVKWKDYILVIKRSKKLNFFPNHWGGVSGFLDDDMNLETKVREELQEELGILPKHIKRIRLGEIFHLDTPQYKKTWIVHPVAVWVDTNKITLDYENAKYRWVLPAETKKLLLIPGFVRILEETSKNEQ